jgi:hypothetical protein
MAKTKDEPQIEDVDDDEDSDDDSDDVPELEEADGSARGKQSKMEKKSRWVQKVKWVCRLGNTGCACSCRIWATLLRLYEESWRGKMVVPASCRMRSGELPPQAWSRDWPTGVVA